MLARYSDGGRLPIKIEVIGMNELTEVTPAEETMIEAWRIGAGGNTIALYQPPS
jgi:hypothetical protein